MLGDTFMLNIFSRLGSDECRSEADLTMFEKFVLNLYCKNSLSASVKDVIRPEMAYALRKSNLILISFLPLLLYWKKNFTVHITSIQWKSAHISSPSLPDPNDYGRLFNKKKNQVSEPVMTSLPLVPALESIIHLTIRNCKTKCSTNRCKCLKKGIELLRDVWKL